MSVVVIHKSSQIVATCSLSRKGYKNFKWFKILVTTHRNSLSKNGRSITRTDLLAYRTELLMSLDVVPSWRLVITWRVSYKLLQYSR